MKKIIIAILLSLNLSFAGESQFGLNQNSLGVMKLPYSGSGLARSYEVAHADSLILNFRNFSTWTAIPRTTLTINTQYEAFFESNQKTSQIVQNGNFYGANLAVPILLNKLVFGAGIEPYTAIEQRFINESVFDGNDVTENVFILGGLSRTHLMLSYKPLSFLSLGLGYEYTFGEIADKVVTKIADNFASKISYEYQRQYNGHGLLLGAHIKPTESLALGIMFRPGINLNYSLEGITPASALNITQEQQVELPSELNLGLEYSLSSKYSGGMDFIYQNWQNDYKLNNNTIPGGNAYFRFGFGFEKKGSNRKFIRYGEQIDYRLGFFYSQLAHYNNGNAVLEYGVSTGLSLPIQRFRSKFSLYSTISKRGSVSTNGLQEWAFKIGLTISANELWFVNLED